MKIFLKKISVPSGTGSIDAAELWRVRWMSRFGTYSSEVKPEMEVFLSLEEANKFKDALEAAFKLIRHTSQVEVVIEKRK